MGGALIFVCIWLFRLVRLFCLVMRAPATWPGARFDLLQDSRRNRRKNLATFFEKLLRRGIQSVCYVRQWRVRERVGHDWRHLPGAFYK
jgi:hypothetical protein